MTISRYKISQLLQYLQNQSVPKLVLVLLTDTAIARITEIANQLTNPTAAPAQTAIAAPLGEVKLI